MLSFFVRVISHRGAEILCCASAALREILCCKQLKQLANCDAELNRNSTAQECDARMVSVEQMLVTKKLIMDN